MVSGYQVTMPLPKTAVRLAAAHRLIRISVSPYLRVSVVCVAVSSPATACPRLQFALPSASGYKEGLRLDGRTYPMAASPVNVHYDVHPKIVRADAEAEITIRPRFGRLPDGGGPFDKLRAAVLSTSKGGGCRLLARVGPSGPSARPRSMPGPG